MEVKRTRQSCSTAAPGYVPSPCLLLFVSTDLGFCAVKEFLRKIIGAAAVVFEPVKFGDDEHPLPHMGLKLRLHKPKIIKSTEGHSFRGRGVCGEHACVSFTPVKRWIAGGKDAQRDLLAFDGQNCPGNTLGSAIGVQPCAYQRSWSDVSPSYHLLVGSHALQCVHWKLPLQLSGPIDGRIRVRSNWNAGCRL